MQRQTIVSVFSLFTSTSTLICCALPALLVALGMGAVLAGLVSEIPQIVWLSEHKIAVFLAAAFMLGLAGFANYYSRDLSCPTDPAQAEACRTARKSSKWIYIASVTIYLLGAAFAFGPALF